MVAESGLQAAESVGCRLGARSAAGGDAAQEGRNSGVTASGSLSEPACRLHSTFKFVCFVSDGLRVA